MKQEAQSISVGMRILDPFFRNWVLVTDVKKSSLKNGKDVMNLTVKALNKEGLVYKIKIKPKSKVQIYEN